MLGRNLVLSLGESMPLEAREINGYNLIPRFKGYISKILKFIVVILKFGELCNTSAVCGAGLATVF